MVLTPPHSPPLPPTTRSSYFDSVEETESSVVPSALDERSQHSASSSSSTSHEHSRKGRTRRLLMVLALPALLVILGSASTILARPGPSALQRDFVSDVLQARTFRPLVASLSSPESHLLSRRSKRDQDESIGRGPYAERSYGDRRHGLVAKSLVIDSSAPSPTKPVLDAGETIAPSIPTPALPIPTPFPQPFDSTLSDDFSSQNCLSFIGAQLSNTTWRQCRSFGLLYENSHEFFQIEANLTALTATLAGTCNTPIDADTCSGIMDWTAAQMMKEDVCYTDLAQKNPTALKIYYGVRAYSVNRKAGCLVNAKTNAYCFAEALTMTAASDLYLYSLPQGIAVPTSVTPSCSSCAHDILALYAPFGDDASSLLSETYPDAAQAASAQCGASYASVPSARVSPTPPVGSNAKSGGNTSAANLVSSPSGSSALLGLVLSLTLGICGGAWILLV